MKDIFIANGLFHLLQSFLNEKAMALHDLNLAITTQEAILQVLSQPIAQQSSYLLFKTCIEHLAEDVSDSTFILEMARHIRAEHFGVLGYMATRSQSVEECLHHIMRFSRLVVDGDEITPMQMSYQQHEITLSWPYLHEDLIILNELNAACMIEMARQMLPLDQLPLTQICFAHKPQMSIYQYQKFYGCEVKFNHPQYEFLIYIISMNIQLDQADPSLMQLLVKQAEEAIASKTHKEQLIPYVEQIIVDYLKTYQQAPKVDYVANAMKVSARTLQRQLSEHGVTFKALLENVRMGMCEKLLVKNVSLIEIANELGYSDQSALARAFKVYKGVTLLQFKQSLKSSKASKTSKALKPST